MSVEEIYTLVWGLFLFVGVVCFIIFYSVYSIKERELKHKFLSTLNDRDKALITEYLITRPKLSDFKKKGK